MTEQAIHDGRQRRIRRQIRRSPGLTVVNDDSVRRVKHQRIRFIATFDKPMLAIVLLLLIIGGLMVFSATWDWSNQTYGTASGFFVEEHLRNVTLSTIALFFFATLDYRFWKRFAIWMLLFTIIALVLVRMYGEVKFGARRSFSGGRLQPGELAEFSVVLYMAAWLGSKGARVDSFLFGLLPFIAVVGVISGLIILQPDLSSAGIVALTAGVMFFVAGANLLHMLAVGGITTAVGIVVVQYWPYAQNRIANFLAGLSDITLTDYHTLQAITAFVRGGLDRRGRRPVAAEIRRAAGAAYRQHLRHRRRGARRVWRGGCCRLVYRLCHPRLPDGADCEGQLRLFALRRLHLLGDHSGAAEHCGHDRRHSVHGRAPALHQFWRIVADGDHDRRWTDAKRSSRGHAAKTDFGTEKRYCEY